MVLKIIIKFGCFIIRKRTQEELLNYYNSKRVVLDDYGNVIECYYNTPKTYDFNFVIKENPYSIYQETGLNCEYFIETNLYVEDENFRKSIENILRAFRIFSSGKLEVPCIFSTDFLSRMNVYPSYVKQEQLYKLNITDIPEIEELFNKIEKNNSNKLNIIFERFDSILSRFSSFKNSFVEMVGIIESIIFQNEKDELRFRFSLYLANLLTTLGQEISFKEAQELYDIRSKLVHTGNDKRFNNNIFQTLMKYTRLIIKWYIENNLNDKKATELFFSNLNFKFK